MFPSHLSLPWAAQGKAAPQPSVTGFKYAAGEGLSILNEIIRLRLKYNIELLRNRLWSLLRKDQCVSQEGMEP